MLLASAQKSWQGIMGGKAYFWVCACRACMTGLPGLQILPWRCAR